VADLLRAVVWPGVTVFAMLLFRDSIAKLIQRIRKVRTRYGDLELDEQAREVRQASALVIPDDAVPVANERIPANYGSDEVLASWFPRSSLSSSEGDEAKWVPVLNLAYTIPTHAIAAAFEIVRVTMAQLAGANDPSRPDRPWSERLAQLEVNRVIPPVIAEVVRRLGQIFDHVVYDPSGVDAAAALDFVVAAKNVVRSLVRELENLEAARRLGAEVQRRRLELDLSIEQLADGARSDVKTLGALEAGQMRDVRALIQLPLIDSALDWATGSAELLLVSGRSPLLIQR
jgi:hypothetical protein